MTFKQLAIGDTFDFIEDGSIYNSFYHRCTKESARTYSWQGSKGQLKSRVASANVEVHHVAWCEQCRKY